jgi:hypothetical protein
MQTDAFQGLLLKGEKIIWWGQPAQGLLLTSRDWFLVPFSLLFAGFAIFWESSVLNATNSPAFMKLWGLPFLLAGLYLVIGRFLADAWARRGITYGVTDRRILIRRSAPFAKFTALTFEQLPSVNLIERSSGRGTIRFGQDQPAWSNHGFSGWSPAFDPTPQFLAIEDARRVFDHIQTTLSKRN